MPDLWLLDLFCLIKKNSTLHPTAHSSVQCWEISQLWLRPTDGRTFFLLYDSHTVCNKMNQLPVCFYLNTSLTPSLEIRRPSSGKFRPTLRAWTGGLVVIFLISVTHYTMPSEKRLPMPEMNIFLKYSLILFNCLGTCGELPLVKLVS